jgi:hypothetical protein
MPETASDFAGYPLLLYRTKMGIDDNLAYADALALLKRGADPNRAGADGMTFAKMLMDHRVHFGRTLKRPPQEFATLWGLGRDASDPPPAIVDDASKLYKRTAPSLRQVVRRTSASSGGFEAI